MPRSRRAARQLAPVIKSAGLELPQIGTGRRETGGGDHKSGLVEDGQGQPDKAGFRPCSRISAPWPCGKAIVVGQSGGGILHQRIQREGTWPIRSRQQAVRSRREFALKTLGSPASPVGVSAICGGTVEYSYIFPVNPALQLYSIVAEPAKVAARAAAAASGEKSAIITRLRNANTNLQR